MSNSIYKQILSFANAQSRNKVVFHRQPIPDLQVTNVSVSLSELIYNFKEVKRLPMKASLLLEKLLNEAVFQNEHLGNCLAIHNIGMLFEPELKLDFAQLLNNYSQNNLLFVKWEGEIDGENLYFLTKEKGIKTNIKHLSHIVI